MGQIQRNAMIDFVSKIMKPLRDRIMLMVARGVIESISENEGLQKVKMELLAGEIRDGMEHFFDYGFTSSPKSGAEAVVVFPGGNREHGLVIKIDDRRFRLKTLAEGEVALYTDEGDKIHFKRGNIIDVDCNTLELGNGTLEKIVNGESFKTLFNMHQHLGNLGVPTGVPITLLTDDPHLSTVVKAAT